MRGSADVADVADDADGTEAGPRTSGWGRQTMDRLAAVAVTRHGLFLAVTGLLAAVALGVVLAAALARAIPAHRAVRVDPLAALRAE